MAGTENSEELKVDFGAEVAVKEMESIRSEMKKLRDDFTKTEKKADKLSEALKNFKSKVKKLVEPLQGLSGSMNELTTDMNQTKESVFGQTILLGNLTKAVKKSADGVDSLDQKMVSLDDSIATINVGFIESKSAIKLEVEEMKKLSDEFQVSTGFAGAFEEQLRETNEELEKQVSLSDGLSGKMTDSSSGVESFGAKIGGVGEQLSSSITAPLMDAAKSCIGFSLEAQKMDKQYETSVGNMKCSFDGFVTSMTEGLSVNETDVKGFLTGFNNMFETMSFGEESSFEMSKGLTQLAYDLSALQGIDQEEAFEKLQEGIQGGTESLAELGVHLDEAAIKNYAYQNGIAESGAELTASQEALATYAAVMAETQNAQGAFAESMNDPIQQIQMQKDTLQTLGQQFGDVMMPLLVQILEPIGNLLTWLKNLDEGHKKIIVTVGGFAAALGPVLIGLGGLLTKFPALDKVMGVASKKLLTLATGPLGMVAAGIFAVIAVSKLLKDNWEILAPFGTAVFQTIQTGAAMMGDGVQVVFLGLKSGFAKLLSNIGGTFLDFLSNVIGKAKDIPVLGKLFGDVSGSLSGLSDGLREFSKKADEELQAARESLEENKDAFKENLSLTKDAASEMVNGLKEKFSGGADDIKADSAPAYADAGKAIGAAMSAGFDTSSGQIQETTDDMMDSVKTSTDDAKAAIVESLKKKTQEFYDTEKKALQDQMDNLEEWKENSVKEVNEVYKTKMKNLNNQKDAALDALEKEKKQLDKWKDSSINSIEKVRDAKLKALQEQLDAIDKQEKAEERAAKQQDEQKKINRLQFLIAYESDDENKKSLQNELNQVLEDRKARLHDEAIEDKKESIKDQMDAVKENAELEKETIEEKYEHQKELMDQRAEEIEAYYTKQQELMEIAKENEMDSIAELYEIKKTNMEVEQANLDTFYEKKLADASLNADAERLLMSQNQENIIKDMNGFGEKYKTAGGTLGKKMVDGFSTRANQIKTIIGDIEKRLNNAEGRAKRLQDEAATASNVTSNSNNTTTNTKNNTVNINGSGYVTDEKALRGRLELELGFLL